jgi:hypothetical protein
MTINLNSNPYYDDFADDKQFHQILFKPGNSIQARELTQIQSIVKDQISKFGNHIFKHGSVVLPGNVNADLSIAHVKLVDTSYDVSTLEGKYVTGSVSGLKALIRKGIKKEIIDGVSDPDTLYVSFTNTGINGEKLFLANEILTVDGITSTTFSTASAAPCGGAAIAYIDKGVYFVNGVFATVLKQSTIISKYSEVPSCRVLLQIVESVVTSDDDSTLLDPAQGSYNYAAPGADRLKIELVLTALALDSLINDDYVEIMRYNEGVLEEHSRYPKYAELEKGLARRTYEAHGDYVINGLTVTAREHLKAGLNGGRYPLPTGNEDKMIYTVQKGKAYIRGFENEKISDVEIVTDKARLAENVKTNVANIVPSYGQFIYVTDLRSLPSFKLHPAVQLLDESGGSVVGTATLLAVDFVESNTTEQNAIYKMFITDVYVNPIYSQDRIGIVRHAGLEIATVLHKLTLLSTNNAAFTLGEEVESENRCGDVGKYIAATNTMYVSTLCPGLPTPYIGDNLVGMTSTGTAKVIDKEVIIKNTNNNLLIEIPFDNVFKVSDAADATDIQYTVYHEAIVNIVGGTATLNVTGLTINPIEAGSFLLVNSAGVVPNATATLAPDGLSVSFAGVTPDGNMSVFSAASVTGAARSPKTKTLVLGATKAVATLAPSKIMLDQADCIRLISVISDEAEEGDVTDRYVFDNGQSDYEYGLGFITLSGVAPIGNLTITYDYYTHNSGDYFTVDSYVTTPDYYDSPLLTYISKNDRKAYDLRKYLDFRPRVGANGTLSGVGASVNNLVQNDYRITTSVRNYVGRIDRVVFNKDNQITVIKGTPDQQPVAPKLPDDSISLALVQVPAYTAKASEVKVTKNSNRVYTMRDVASLDNRVGRIEEYITLSETEQSAVNYDIMDAKTGLSRYKSGYLVENFMNADAIADTKDPAFKVAYTSGYIRPQFDIVEAELISDSSGSDVQSTNSVMTLPYTNILLAQQPVSSRITNVNPFAVFSWAGTVNIIPSEDTWTDTENLAPIVNTRTETVTDVVVVQRTLPPVVIPAPITNVITNITQVTNITQPVFTVVVPAPIIVRPITIAAAPVVPVAPPVVVPPPPVPVPVVIGPTAPAPLPPPPAPPVVVPPAPPLPPPPVLRTFSTGGERFDRPFVMNVTPTPVGPISSNISPMGGGRIWNSMAKIQHN